MQGAERTGDEVMTKRNGISLVNVMVFMLFAGMVTAQVFFFMSSSMDSIGEEREIMMYRLRLDTLVKEAKKELEKPEKTGVKIIGIKHDENLNNNIPDDDTNSLTYATFFDGNGIVHTQTKYWDGSAWKNWDKKENSDWDEEETYYAVIFDLDYKFDATFDRSKYIENYSGSKMYKKVFAAMNPPVVYEDSEYDNDTKEPKTPPKRRYYLIRACAKLPQKFYGQHLMYQVLVRRNNEDKEDEAHKVDTLSFQEVWF